MLEGVPVDPDKEENGFWGEIGMGKHAHKDT